MLDIMVGMLIMMAVLAILGALAAAVGADSRPGARRRPREPSPRGLVVSTPPSGERSAHAE